MPGINPTPVNTWDVLGWVNYCGFLGAELIGVVCIQDELLYSVDDTPNVSRL
jgi:hypothetical protein